MKTIDRFNKIVFRYANAYEACNGYRPFNIWFNNGWVYLRSKEEYAANKYRVSQFEKMCDTLEGRLAKIQPKETISATISPDGVQDKG